MASRLIEDKIQKFFIDHTMTLSLAESCTGGGVAARLVRVPNCSFYFLGGVVCYSREAKEKILGVNSETLSLYGEVSSQTAEQMAAGALEQFGSDIAMAITGIAGPSGGNLQKPVGTVFFGIASRTEKPLFWKHLFEGSRSQIIALSVEAALEHLWTYVN
jgi:PncC family amidohydrolase